MIIIDTTQYKVKITSIPCFIFNNRTILTKSIRFNQRRCKNKKAYIFSVMIQEIYDHALDLDVQSIKYFQVGYMIKYTFMKIINHPGIFQDE